LLAVGIDPDGAQLAQLTGTWYAETWDVRAPGLDAILKLRPFDLGQCLAAEPDSRFRTFARAFPLTPWFLPLEELLAPLRSALGDRIPRVLDEGRLADGVRFTLLSRLPGRRRNPSWQRDAAQRRLVSRQMGALAREMHATAVPAANSLPAAAWLDAITETLHCVADHLADIDRRPGRRRHEYHERFAAVAARLRRQNLGPHVLTHGDFHPDNLLFGADDAITGVVDFDIAGVGPAALDLRHIASLDEREFAAGYGLPNADLDALCWSAHALDLLWHGLVLVAQHRLVAQPVPRRPWAHAVAHVEYLLALCERDRLRRGRPFLRRGAEALARAKASLRLRGTPGCAPADRTDAANRVAIVVVAWNHFATTTGPCLAALRAYTDVPYRVICVDNHSTDTTPTALAALAQSDPRIEVVSLAANEGWAGGSLAGLQRLRANDTHVVLLNSDTIVTPGWLRKLLRHVRAQFAPTVVIPREDGPRARRATPATTEPPIAPGSGLLPPPAPPLAAVLRHAAAVERAERDRSAAAVPSGFCLLFAVDRRPVVEEYLRDFDSFHTRARDWFAWWQTQGTQCRVALDCYVFHARGGSGGYYAYDRAAREVLATREDHA
jgi:aminoglycoside phosphotransferase